MSPRRCSEFTARASCSLHPPAGDDTVSLQLDARLTRKKKKNHLKKQNKTKNSVVETPENRRDSCCYPVSLPVCPRGWGSTDGSSGRNLTHERVQQNNIHRLDMSARLIMTLQMEWVRVSQFISCLLPPFRTAWCCAEDKSAPKWTDSR